MKRPSIFVWRPAVKRLLIIAGVLLALVAIVTVATMLYAPTTKVTLAGTTFDLRVANTEEARIQGLSGVEGLAQNGGLLMEFPEDDDWGIWMKDMKIPLDIVWLNSDKKVVHIIKSATPDLSTDVVFSPRQPTRYVIELQAGAVVRAGIEIGQVAEFKQSREVR